MPGQACSGPLTGAYTDPAGDSRARAVGCRSRPSHFLQVADYPLVAPAAPDGAPRADSHAGRQCPDGGSRCLTGRQSRRSSASRRRLASRRGRSPRQLSVPGSHSRALRPSSCQCGPCRRMLRPAPGAVASLAVRDASSKHNTSTVQHRSAASEHSESRRRLHAKVLLRPAPCPLLQPEVCCRDHYRVPPMPVTRLSCASEWHCSSCITGHVSHYVTPTREKAFST